MSEDAHAAVMAFPEFITEPRGEIRVKVSICCIYTASQKKLPDIINCNLKKDDQILIVFGTNIPDTTLIIIYSFNTVDIRNL